MCDSVICTFGVMRGELLEPALNLTAKGGNCVVTSVAPMMQGQADLNLFMLAMMNKQISGSLYGSANPRVAIPQLLDMYRDGIIKIDELITKTYTLDQVNEGYADLEAGKILRGALIFYRCSRQPCRAADLGQPGKVSGAVVVRPGVGDRRVHDLADEVRRGSARRRGRVRAAARPCARGRRPGCSRPRRRPRSPR